MAPDVRGRLCWEGTGTFTALPGTVSLTGGESELTTVHDLSLIERGSRGEKLRIDGAEIVCRGVKDPTFKHGGGRMKLKANPAWVNGEEQQVCRGRTALKGELPGTFTLTGGRPTVAVTANVEKVFDAETTITLVDPDGGEHECEVKTCEPFVAGGGSLWLDLPPQCVARGGGRRASLRPVLWGAHRRPRGRLRRRSGLCERWG